VTSRLLIPIVGALVLAASVASPASAYTLVSKTGTVGGWSFDEGSSLQTASGHCAYGANVVYNWVYFKSMTVKPPTVKAINRTTKQDHQTVGWQLVMQQHLIALPMTGSWTTIKKSSIQKKTAYDNAAALFTALTVKYDAQVHDPDFQSLPYAYRALVVITWYKADGTVQGTVKLAPSYYKNTSSTNYIIPFVGSQPWCQAVNTTG
jgi:hypothetical protein